MKQWPIYIILILLISIPAYLVLDDYLGEVGKQSNKSVTLKLVGDDDTSGTLSEDKISSQVLSKVFNQANTNTQEIASSVEMPTVGDRMTGVLSLLNGKELAYYDKLGDQGEIDWDAYQNIINDGSIRFSSVDTIFNRLKVFGWHPYWMGSAYESYEFNLLSHVSWFAYNIDPYTGGYTNPSVIADWRTTDMVTLAKGEDPTKGCKVLMTIANHTKQGNRIFLRNEYNQQERLIDSLLLLLKERNADGIDVNFELVPDGLQPEMTAFLLKLSDKLHANDKIMTLVLPQVNKPVGKQSKIRAKQRQVYDIEKLKDKVDLFIITGYDFHTGKSPNDGPVAPLKSKGKYSIENSVYAYLKSGVPREKLILSLPYYGASWSGSKFKEGGSELDDLYFEGHLTYRAIEAKYGRSHQKTYDPLSWSASYLLQPDSNSIMRVWFDDSLTLGKKYDWVKDENLAGVGIWALGYDNGSNDLWNLMASRIGDQNIYGVQYTQPQINAWFFQLATTLFTYRHIFILLAILLTTAFLLGLAVAIFDYRVRDIFFNNRTLRVIYAVASISTLFCLYYILLFVSQYKDNSWLKLYPFVVGLALGGVATMVVYHFFNKNRSNLP